MAFVRDPSTGVEVAALMDLFTLLREYKLAGETEKQGIHVRNRSVYSGMNQNLSDVFDAMGIDESLYPARIRFTTYADRNKYMYE